jgi:mRNA interferase YafQ
MLKQKTGSKFRRDVKKIRDQKTLDELKHVIRLLVNESKLDEKYHLHPLEPKSRGILECHIRPDVLLIFTVKDGILKLIRLGSHGNLFKK